LTSLSVKELVDLLLEVDADWKKYESSASGRAMLSGAVRGYQARHWTNGDGGMTDGDVWLP
jgi:hypothetical protein